MKSIDSKVLSYSETPLFYEGVNWQQKENAKGFRKKNGLGWAGAFGIDFNEQCISENSDLFSSEAGGNQLFPLIKILALRGKFYINSSAALFL